MLLEEWPELVKELAALDQVPVPDDVQPTAAPTSYPMPDGSTIHGDAVVRFQDGEGKARFFAQVEVQGEYNLGKLATIRAYHGGEVRRSMCGGHMWVLSPRAAETRRFRENDALYREEFAYRASYLSGADLAPLAGPGRSLAARALAAAVTDLERDGVPSGARDLLLELQHDKKDQVADLMFKAMIEKCADISDLEVGMTDAAMDRLLTLPTFRDFITRREAEVAAKAAARAKAEAEAEAAKAKAEAEAEAARAKAEVLRDALLTYFASRGDNPSSEALAALEACVSQVTLQSWFNRACRGETSVQILEKED